MRVTFISDTHGFHAQVPYEPTDLLIHSGDATNSKSPYTNEHEWFDFWDWFKGYPSKYKLYVAGNHDAFLASPISKTFRKQEADQSTVKIVTKSENFIFGGLKFFASPYTPQFNNWHFMINRDTIHKQWDMMDDSVDVVVTHGPPMYHLDATIDRDHSNKFVGCRSLKRKIYEVKPQYHVFGHVHGNAKFDNNGILTRQGINFVNASMVTDAKFSKGITQKPIIVDIPKSLYQ